MPNPRSLRSALPLIASICLIMLVASPLAAQIKVNIQSVDSGKYVARCHDCIPGATTPDSMFVHVDDPSVPYAIWILEPNGKTYTLRSFDSGRWAARCHDCIREASAPDSVMVHNTNAKSPWANWILKRNEKGYYTLRSADSGKYAARCRGCTPAGGDNVMVHVEDPSAPFAQWKITIVP